MSLRNAVKLKRERYKNANCHLVEVPGKDFVLIVPAEIHLNDVEKYIQEKLAALSNDYQEVEAL